MSIFPTTIYSEFLIENNSAWEALSSPIRNYCRLGTKQTEKVRRFQCSGRHIFLPRNVQNCWQNAPACRSGLALTWPSIVLRSLSGQTMTYLLSTAATKAAEGRAKVTTSIAGRWSNGKTPGLQPGDRGSIPRRSTSGLVVKWENSNSADWQSGFDSQWVR